MGGKKSASEDPKGLVLSGQQMLAEKQAELQQALRDGADGATGAEDFDAPADRPCTVYALGATCSGGCLGALYGFGIKLVTHKGKGRLLAARKEALSSAKAFAVFGGVYALANCIIQRLRQKEDAITSGAAGAATGFVMGIGGGPSSALASAAMMGAFSLVLDNFSKTQEAEARSLGVRSSHCGPNFELAREFSDRKQLFFPRLAQ